MTPGRKFPVPLPGPLGDIADALGHPGEAIELGKKITRLGAARLKEANQDFNDADRVVRSIRMKRKRRSG